MAGRHSDSVPSSRSCADLAAREPTPAAAVGRLMALVTHGPNKVRIYIRYVRYLLWEFRLPLSVFAVVGLLRRAGPPSLLPPRARELCSRLPRGLPDDLPGVGARLPRRVVSPAVLLPPADHRAGGGGRLGGPARLPDVHPEAETPGVAAHGRLAVSQPRRRGGGGEGRLPGHQGAARAPRVGGRGRPGGRVAPDRRHPRPGGPGHPGQRAAIRRRSSRRASPRHAR